MKEYGAMVQHSSAVVNPRLTTLPFCFSSHCTFASNAAARPETLNGLDTRAPCPGSMIHTCASVVAGSPSASGSLAGTPSTVSVWLPSSSSSTGTRPCCSAACAV